MLKRTGCLIFLILWVAGVALPMGRNVPEEGLTAVLDRSYDPDREITFEGRVLRVDPAPCNALPISNEHLHVLLGEDPAEIDLGPCWYIDAQNMRIRKGDVISVVGSEAVQAQGTPHVIVAREIRRGNEILRLRDASGKPLWRQKQ